MIIINFHYCLAKSMRFFASLRMTIVYGVRGERGGGWRLRLQPPPLTKTQISVILSETK